uniref:Exocyst complex component n=1 Tax=Xenopsylla cheopis TaxID=163159 RepID=A0A6M2DPL4_XENCH
MGVMANVSIQEIEAVDDYWGPTFRSIYEGDGHQSLMEQLESRIKSHDKEIERMCSQYYQGFIESIRELLQVRTQSQRLNVEVVEIDADLQQIASGILEKGEALVKARTIEGNIASVIQSIEACLPVLETYSKLLKQVREKRYYPALKTLEQLEGVHLPSVAQHKFCQQMKDSVPKLRESIKDTSMTDLKDFLENIRKFSPRIGEVAMRHTKEQEKRDLSSVISIIKASDSTHVQQNGFLDDDEDVSAQDLIDFSPVYRCSHIYTILGSWNEFEQYYRQQRNQQARLVLQPTQNMHESLEAYKIYLQSVVGFFVIEDHVLNTGGDLVGKAYLDELWTVSQTRMINSLRTHFAYCTDSTLMLNIKNLIILASNTLRTYGYVLTPVNDLLLEMRDHYNEVLMQQWVHIFRNILEKGDFLPMQANNQEEFNEVVAAFPFDYESMEKDEFPRKFPFSTMVPDVYKQVKSFMKSCLRFSEELKLPQSEIDSMVRRASNLLLTRSFSGCLSALFKSPSLALMQVIQILIDTQYLESASQHLDEYVCELTGTPHAPQTPEAMFRVARNDAEKQICDKLRQKLTEFLELENYNWLLVEPAGHASPFVSDMIAFLHSTFKAFSSLPAGVARVACKSACQHVAESMYALLLSDDVKQISMGALQQINLDIIQCEQFAACEPVYGLSEGLLLQYFADIRQLLDLLLSWDWPAYFHDYGKDSPQRRYERVKPLDALCVLDKVREADKRTMFSVLKKSERDKRKLLETVLRQLRQLASVAGNN